IWGARDKASAPRLWFNRGPAPGGRRHRRRDGDCRRTGPTGARPPAGDPEALHPGAWHLAGEHLAGEHLVGERRLSVPLRAERLRRGAPDGGSAYGHAAGAADDIADDALRAGPGPDAAP